MINGYLWTLAIVSALYLILSWCLKPFMRNRNVYRYVGGASIVGVCACAILFTKAMLYEFIVIPSESMLPTYQVGTKVLMDRNGFQSANQAASTLKRGDVSVWQFPGNTDILFIKRIVGLPGDAISMNKAGITINGHQHVFELIDDEDHIYQVKIGEHRWSIIIDPDEELVTIPTTIVPESTYFLLGDNLTKSGDSRTYGPLRISYFEGAPI